MAVGVGQSMSSTISVYGRPGDAVPSMGLERGAVDVMVEAKTMRRTSVRRRNLIRTSRLPHHCPLVEQKGLCASDLGMY